MRRVGALGVFSNVSKDPFLAAERVVNVIPFANFGKKSPFIPSPYVINTQYKKKDKKMSLREGAKKVNSTDLVLWRESI